MKTKIKLTFQELLDKTKRTQYTDKDLVAEIESCEQELEFFKIGKYVTENGLEAEYISRNLEPASPYALAVYDLIHREKMDGMSFLGTHWKDKNGNWCFASFDRWFDDRRVYVHRDGRDWDGSWWFGAVKKPAFNKPKPALREGEKELIVKRLLPNVEKTDTCWNWTGVVSKGYGLIKVHSRSTRVHRLMYEVFVGPIPEGLVIDHLCRNKKCVNPEHLEVVTSRENTLRGEGPTSRKAKAKLQKS